ncbi:signal transduction protein [bacterium SM23_31]|nr:MAG: signal transduction protein [bacterium SM23_31]
MTVESIMTRKVVTVESDDSLKIIQEIFENVGFHHLLVVENGKLVGVISDHDLFKALSPFIGRTLERRQDIALLNKKAHQIMSIKPVTVDKEFRIKYAARLMLEKNVSCLPVTSPEGNIEGIVTWKDIFKAYLRESEDEC